MVLFHWWNFVLSTEFRGRIRAFLTIDAHHHSLPWAGPLLVQIVDQRRHFRALMLLRVGAFTPLRTVRHVS